LRCHYPPERRRDGLPSNRRLAWVGHEHGIVLVEIDERIEVAGIEMALEERVAVVRGLGSHDCRRSRVLRARPVPTRTSLRPSSHDQGRVLETRNASQSCEADGRARSRLPRSPLTVLRYASCSRTLRTRA